ncbi:PA14 domain-containing protein [Cavenderia fasciculata]|uniref:PA14 domain-containing protein n=1 Tax=Cavenderia fasciculata TaxID=261658 RepID=F4PUE2_CACFS|nr:PA14 domain-containing protein [Cavenderia fasciculata]EGG21014.1 PA14 domain-containing protein [Cavenderia fasciculata]|eukprot:XP_004358864.1 PA14 domain-containing protein [Cavenderia fasciculata]
MFRISSSISTIFYIAIVSLFLVNCVYAYGDDPYPPSSPCCDAVWDSATNTSRCDGSIKKARCVGYNFYGNETGIYECVVSCMTDYTLDGFIVLFFVIVPISCILFCCILGGVTAYIIHKKKKNNRHKQIQLDQNQHQNNDKTSLLQNQPSVYSNYSQQPPTNNNNNNYNNNGSSSLYSSNNVNRFQPFHTWFNNHHYLFIHYLFSWIVALPHPYSTKILYTLTFIIVRAQDQINFVCTIRDLTPERNPDFEIDSPNKVITGIVRKNLGQDRKPVYCCEDQPYPSKSQFVVHNQTTFYSWFNDVENVNIPINVVFTLTNNRTDNPNVYSYKNDQFFPIDGKGWEAPEMHARFTYLGGEVFKFQGDDDVFVFINNLLVVDLGAPHEIKDGQAYRELTLDTLGLQKGKDYPFDFFYCERHSVESHIELSTSIQLKCGYIDYCGVCEGDGSSCCHPEVHCDDKDKCTVDKCPPPRSQISKDQISKYCTHEYKICDNTDVCSESKCDPTTGECKKGDNLSCFPQDCKIVSCAPNAGCQYQDMACDENRSCQKGRCDNSTCIYVPIKCDDSNECTVNSCKEGVGCVYSPKICDDLDSCTVDTCNNSTGCVHTKIPNCVSCSTKGLVCKTVDLCKPQECNQDATGCVTKDLNCNDGNPCTIDTCLNGTCVNSPKCLSNSCQYASCDVETTGGECVYQQRNCDDLNVCTVDDCDPSLPVGKSCTHKPDPCDDKNACTMDACVSMNSTTTELNKCVHTPVVCPHKPCMEVACLPTSGCVYTPVKCPTNNFCDVATCDANAGGCISYNRTCNAENRDCQNTTCNRENQKCESRNYDPLPFKCQSAAVKAGVAVGAAAIAGIVIGAAAAVGLAAFGGKKGYDLWKQNRAAKMSVTASNPLYTPNPNQGTNPLYGGPPA